MFFLQLGTPGEEGVPGGEGTWKPSLHPRLLVLAEALPISLAPGVSGRSRCSNCQRGWPQVIPGIYVQLP